MKSGEPETMVELIFFGLSNEGKLHSWSKKILLVSLFTRSVDQSAIETVRSPQISVTLRGM